MGICRLNPLLLLIVHGISKYLINDALVPKDGGLYSYENVDSFRP